MDCAEEEFDDDMCLVFSKVKSSFCIVLRWDPNGMHWTTGEDIDNFKCCVVCTSLSCSTKS